MYGHSSSTPMGKPGTSKFAFTEENEVSKIHSNKKQTTLEMICEAIKVVGLPRKGASYIAIKKYVLSKVEDPESARMKSSIKKALIKGVQQGVLGRPSKSKESIGATGSFVLGKKLTANGSKNSSKESEPKAKKRIGASSDSEAAVKKSKKKLNLSDTALLDMKKTKPKVEKLKPTVVDSKTKIAKKDKIKTKKADGENTENAKNAKDKPLKRATVKKATDGKNKVKPAEVIATKKPLKVKMDYKPKKKVNKGGVRQDVSDSEVVVKKPNRKSLKSYSSDTEVGNGYKTKNVPPKTGVKSATKLASLQKVTSPKHPVKGKKLYKEDQNQTDKKDATTMKAGRNKVKGT